MQNYPVGKELTNIRMISVDIKLLRDLVLIPMTV